MKEGKKGIRSIEYNKGYEAAAKDFLDDEKLKEFKEGYKIGYRDGYQAALNDLKKSALLKLPPEVRQQMEEGAQPWDWPW